MYGPRSRCGRNGRGHRADSCNVLGQFTLVHLFAIDDDVGRSSDTEPDLIAAEADHGDDDIATDSQGLVGKSPVPSRPGSRTRVGMAMVYR